MSTPCLHRPRSATLERLGASLCLLLASSAVQAHGITLSTEGLVLLALVVIALPAIVIGLLLWVIATFSVPLSAVDQPLTGWRRSASRGGATLAVVGGLLALWLFIQSRDKEDRVALDREAERARSEARQQDSQRQAVARQLAFEQCKTRRQFVGHWNVDSRGAYYMIGLYADGSFSLRDFIPKTGARRLAREGQWHIELKQASDPRSLSLVFVSSDKLAPKRVSQRMVRMAPNEIMLQDAKGDRLLYTRDQLSPEAPPCTPPP